MINSFLIKNSYYKQEIGEFETLLSTLFISFPNKKKYYDKLIFFFI